MPLPGYIICSVSGSQDQFIKAVSLFNVIEAVQIPEEQSQPDGARATTSFQMRITAVWLRDDADSPEQEFMLDFSMIVPGSEEEVVILSFPSFRFRHISVLRIIAPDFQFTTAALNPGLLRIVCRLRRAEDQDWTHRQVFTIIVHRGELAARQATAPPQATP